MMNYSSYLGTTDFANILYSAYGYDTLVPPHVGLGLVCVCDVLP